MKSLLNYPTMILRAAQSPSEGRKPYLPCELHLLWRTAMGYFLFLKRNQSTSCLSLFRQSTKLLIQRHTFVWDFSGAFQVSSLKCPDYFFTHTGYGFFVCSKLSNTKSAALRTIESITMHDLTLRNTPPFHEVVDPISGSFFLSSLFCSLRKRALKMFPIKQTEFWMSSQDKRNTHPAPKWIWNWKKQDEVPGRDPHSRRIPFQTSKQPPVLWKTAVFLAGISEERKGKFRVVFTTIKMVWPS